MPKSVLAVATLFHVFAVIFLGLAMLLVIVRSPGDGGAMSYVAALFATYSVGCEAVAIGLYKRRSWARTAGFVLFVICGAGGLCELLGLGSRSENRRWHAIWVVTSAAGIILLRRPAAADWFDPDFEPETSPAPAPTPQRPAQVVGLTCAGCGNRIAAEFEAEVCTKCATAMHRPCRAGSGGKCPRCGHVEGVVPPPPPPPPPKPGIERLLRPARPAGTRPLIGSVCVGCAEWIQSDRDAAACGKCGNPIHHLCKRPPTPSTCEGCGYRSFA